MSDTNITEDLQQTDETDVPYNDEKARAAVGRLFGDVEPEQEPEEADDGPPPIKSAFVTGFERGGKRGSRRGSESDREEQSDRPPRRRESATSRLVGGSGVNSGSASNEEADHPRGAPPNPGRRRNPDPIPAVLVNVPTERPHQEPPQEPRRPRKEGGAWNRDAG